MKRRRYDYDLLRVLAMFGVIYQHVAAETLRTLDHSLLWEVSNVLVCLCTPAVPLFFMMSGALLLEDEKTADLGYLFRRRLPRLMAPLALFSGLVLLAQTLRGDPQGALVRLAGLFHEPAATPYWYLYALIPMYLISPFLYHMARVLSDTHWNYLIALWLLLTIGLATLRSFLPYDIQVILTEHWTLNLNFVGGYLGYFLLGARLERWEKTPPQGLLWGVAGVTLAVMILGTRRDTYAGWVYSTRYTDYLALFSVLLSACLFLLARARCRDRAPRGRLLEGLVGLSFPVYLLHPLVIGAVRALWPRLFGVAYPATLPQQLLLFAAASLVSIGAAAALAAIPGIGPLLTGRSSRSASS